MRLGDGPGGDAAKTPEGSSRPAESAAGFVGATCIDFSKVPSFASSTLTAQ